MAIQRLLGHSSIEIPSDQYGHLLPEADEGMITAVEESFRGIDFAEWEAELRDTRDSPQTNRWGNWGELNPGKPLPTLSNTDVDNKNPQVEAIPASLPGATECARGDLNPHAR